MIISASRRTDIPALYSDWLMNRVRAGFCDVVNPYDPGRSTRVDLRPENVTALVFWTRHAAPLLPRLKELDALGYHYYFLYSLLGQPRELDPRSPERDVAIAAFRALTDQIGPERVIWRYDPIILNEAMDARFHAEHFSRIARALAGHTSRCVISFVDHYRKTERRLKALPARLRPRKPDASALKKLVPDLASLARTHGLTLESCAEEIDLKPYGVTPGKCIDDALIRRVFGVDVTNRKDPSQRQNCGCVMSRDIGAYDTCVMGCLYCYATSRFDRAQQRHARHDPHATALAPLTKP